MPVVFWRKGPETKFATWRMAYRRGRMTRLVDGGTVELFTRRVMGEALERSGAWIVLSERLGNFPPPTFRIESHRARYYTADQVVNANNIYRVLRLTRSAPQACMARFFEAIRVAFDLERRLSLEELKEIRDRFFLHPSVVKKRKSANDVAKDETS